jgi:hypothetical protein
MLNKLMLLLLQKKAASALALGEARVEEEAPGKAKKDASLSSPQCSHACCCHHCTQRETTNSDTSLMGATIAFFLLATATTSPTANNPNQPPPHSLGIKEIHNENIDKDNNVCATVPPSCSHSHPPALDSLMGLGPTCNGWQDNMCRAEEIVPNFFDDFLITMGRKQTMHKGNHSHLELHALDGLIGLDLTYIHWQDYV